MLPGKFEAHKAREHRPREVLTIVQGTIAKHAAAFGIILFCSTLWASLLLNEGPRIFLLDDAGYGDSYVAYAVQQYQQTGAIYPDVSRPPYTPLAYGPLLYTLFSVPSRIRAWENPFLGMRTVSIASFLLCITMVISIARKLVPERNAWVWALLLAGSIASMHDWAPQIRGDFPAIFLALAAIRLLLTGTPWAVVLAGVCAGCVTGFKFTMVAALAAGSLWFLSRRCWNDLARFTSAGLLASVGLYAFWSIHEPRMISQLAATRISMVEIPGWIASARRALAEPVVLLAMAAIPGILRKVSAPWSLLILFAVAAWTIAGVTELHPGANINYFYEGLFAVTPAAVLGVYQIRTLARTHPGLSLFIGAVFVLVLALPVADMLYFSYSRHESGFRAVAARNASFRKLEDALRDQHIFSTVGRLALFDPEPAIVSSFNFWEIDPRRIYERIGQSEFDVVITDSPPVVYRGIDKVYPDLRKAVELTYAPACLLQGSLLQLPRNRPASAGLLKKLYRIGCLPAAPNYASW